MASAEQIFNAILTDAKHVNNARAKVLKRSLDAAKAELVSAKKQHSLAPLALKAARLLAVNRASKSLAAVQKDMIELIKKGPAPKTALAPATPRGRPMTEQERMARQIQLAARPATSARPIPARPATAGRPKATPAQAQMAGQIRSQRVDLLKAKQEVFNAKTPADKARAEKVLLDKARRLAVLVPGKQRKTSALVKISPAVRKVEGASLKKRINELRAKIAQTQAALQAAGGAQPASTILRIRLNKLQSEMQSAQRKLMLNSRGVIRRKPRKLQPSSVPLLRPRIAMPSMDIAPSPIAVQQGLSNLISALPKKPGESAEAYRNRLEAYLQRLIARLIAMLAEGQDEPSALQAATTQTITEDSSALEAEAAAGGVAADPAAEAVEDIVDGAAGPALDTIEEQVAQAEAVDTASVDEIIVQAEGAEAQLSEGTTPAEYTAASDTDASIQQAAAQEAVAAGSAAAQAGSEGFYEQAAEVLADQYTTYAPQAPAATDAPADYTLPTVEGKPFWKHPVVIGGVALTGLFLLLRR